MWHVTSMDVGNFVYASFVFEVGDTPGVLVVILKKYFPLTCPNGVLGLFCLLTKIVDDASKASAIVYM